MNDDDTTTEYRVVYFPTDRAGTVTKPARDRADAERIAAEMGGENPLIETRTITRTPWRIIHNSAAAAPPPDPDLETLRREYPATVALQNRARSRWTALAKRQRELLLMFKPGPRPDPNGDHRWYLVVCADGLRRLFAVANRHGEKRLLPGRYSARTVSALLGDDGMLQCGAELTEADRADLLGYRGDGPVYPIELTDLGREALAWV